MRRHEVDALSLVAGALFLAAAVAFLTAGDGVVDHARWLWPALLVGLGAAGVASALRRDGERHDDPVPPPPAP